jgi:hypothetical protein
MGNIPFPAPAPNMPFMPPLEPYILPSRAFDMLLGNYGIKLLWQRSHLCACTFGGTIPGSPDYQCTTCHGRGWYWDSPYGPWTGLITFIHMSPTPDEAGQVNNEKFGFISRAEPTLTIPRSLGPFDNPGYNDILSDPNILLESDIFNLTVTDGAENKAWLEASLNDIFTEIDAITRFETELQVGGVTTVPYQQQLSIPVSGAVTVYNTTTHRVDSVSSYTVSGAQVTLSSGYASGTAYVVSYTAAKSYVAWRNAGAQPHARPFAQSGQPRRFRLQELDLWLRGSGKV